MSCAVHRWDAGSRCTLLTASLLVGLALGSRAASVQAADAPASSAPAADSDPGFFTGLFAPSRNNLLGDAGGLRTWLGRYGISVSLSETSEVLGNVSGGIRRGFEYDGLTTAGVQIDAGKALGLEGGTFNASALQIHGRNLSADNLATLQTSSGIESNRATRLWELWYEQALFDGEAAIKIGQQSIDQEFISSQYSALYLNTMMGWPMIPSADLYAGGPAYPLSSPGVRLRVQPAKSVTLLAGAFDDNPPGGPFASDSQLRGREASGTAFNLNTGALLIAEIQYALNQPAEGDTVTPDQKSGLAGTYKLGFWYDTAPFPDQRYNFAGQALAGFGGTPRSDAGNFSLYAVADQTVWQPDPNDPQSLSVFARAMGAPGDRNLIDFSIDAGVNLKAPLPGRDNDTFGVGYGLAKVSSGASGFDRDTNFYGGGPVPVRSVEQFVEVTYQYQICPWWMVQPDFQYVLDPGAGASNPNAPTQKLGDEAILGVRTAITF
jgi:porin